MALYDAHEMRIASAAVPHVTSRYRAPRARWASLAVIAGLHVVAIATLDLVGVLPVRRLSSELKVIELSAEAMPPPPVVQPKEKPPVELPKLATEPAPASAVVQASPPVAVAPPANAIVAAPTAVPTAPLPAPAPQAPAHVSDLDARAVTIIPPKYPLESRRRREQGTVVIAITLDPEGKVATVSLTRSSGFERLDKAALEAVRRWRWSPTIRAGEAVSVRGIVEIPFELTG